MEWIVFTALLKKAECRKELATKGTEEHRGKIIKPFCSLVSFVVKDF